jgi:hypothetical protein
MSVWQGHRLPISYARFGSSSFSQRLFLFPDYVVQVKSLLLLSSIFPSTLIQSIAMRCKEKWVHGHEGPE